MSRKYEGADVDDFLEHQKMPDDIKKAATDAVMAPKVTGALFTDNYIMPVARAILAERFRCANVLDAEIEWGGNPRDAYHVILDGTEPRQVPGYNCAYEDDE